MAIMLNPNAIPKGSITQEMIDASAFEGIYELLTAGYALNLVGKGNGEPQAFMSRKTGGGNITDGSAVIKEVDGVQPIAWNQLINRQTAPTALVDSTITESENEIIITTSTAYGGAKINLGTKIIVGHKYLIVAEAKSLIRAVMSSNEGGILVTITDPNYTLLSAIGVARDKDDKKVFYFWNTQAQENTISVKKSSLMCHDLTQMFGAGNEPSTYEEYLDRISHYHISDEYAYNAGEVVNYKGIGIKTTNIDGTKSYVRDWSEVMRKYFPDGMTSLGGVKDFFNDRKAVRKYKTIDLSSIGWFIAQADTHTFYSDVVTNYPSYGQLACAEYLVAGNGVTAEVVAGPDKAIWRGRDKRFYIKDSSCSEVSDIIAKLKGVTVYYELAEPVEDIFEKPLNLTYTVINGGTETSLATENSTQFEGSIAYNKDYVAVVDELQMQNRVIQIEFENWEN